MARNDDYSTDSEVKDIMERIYNKFPTVFTGLKIDEILFIRIKNKSNRYAIKVKAVGFPVEVFAGKPFLVSLFDNVWMEMDEKRRNLAVFKAMCAFKEGSFDPMSKEYGKLAKPDFDMYRLEFAASGGVPDWMEDGRARDPMDIEPDKLEITGKCPVVSV